MELENRIEGRGPIFISSYSSGHKIEPKLIEVGNKVILKSNDIDVLVNVLEIDGNYFKGSIIGFENYFGESLRGRRVNDLVNFEYNNIFSCLK